MSDWSATDLSTSASIAKIEEEINDLTSSNWDNKIATAKTMIGRRLENALADRGIEVNEKDSEVLLDVIVDPDVTFGLSSDFLTLHLIYNDLSMSGSPGSYEDKAKYYRDIWQEQMAEDIQAMNLDPNLDDTTDSYRTDWKQRLQR